MLSHPIRAAWRVALVMALSAAFPGCGGDSATSPDAGSSFAGTYRLQSINGLPLPFVNFDQGGSKDEITSETITLSASGSWTHSYSERITTNGQVILQNGQTAGSFTTAGASLSFKSTTNELFTGMVSGNTLVLQRQARTLSYLKQ
jgi:hypothetical protein